MQKVASKLVFSPSDLIKLMESEIITWLDRFDIERPGVIARDSDTETNKILQDRGKKHESEFLASLRAAGRQIVDVSTEKDRFGATLKAMKDGAEVIYQAALRDEEFVGYSDFLERVDGESALGDYHYEPLDTKLALTEKPYFLVQLCCYSDLLGLIQGVIPKKIHVVLGNKEISSFRTDDFVYYYKQLRRVLIEQQRMFDVESAPECIGLEDFGSWNSHMEQLFEERDHLCRVANIRTVQIKRLLAAGINTMTELANSSLVWIPRMQENTFDTLKQQARLQLESKELKRPKFELISTRVVGMGLTMLPRPSTLDVYFDMEGFPLADGGLEYLFGVTVLESGSPSFKDWWAHNRQEEKEAFEAFVDWLYDRWKRDPGMHVYHYASYEKTALRRLMGKYGTREREVDDLLRNEVFVDLYNIVRQSMKVGTPNYSIKSIEQLYQEKRSGDVATAMDSVVFYQHWLDEQDGKDWQTSKILADIRAYNKEDCDSTFQLAEWLRKLQAAQSIPPRQRKIKELTKNTPAAESRSAASSLAATLREGVSQDPSIRTEDMRVQELLAYLLEFHRREAKPVFWAKYDRADMTESERYDDAGCLARLVRTETPPMSHARSLLYEYKFDPNQDTSIDAGDVCFFAHDLEQKISVGDIDVERGLIRLKRSKQNNEEPPNTLSLIKDEFVDADVIAQSIYRTVQSYSIGSALRPALKDFLYRHAPRVEGVTGALIRNKADLVSETTRVISNLQDSTLCIQGPPGAGKTYTASKAICALIRAGKSVGVTSNGHKAIAHLMDKVAEEARIQGVRMRAFKLQSKKEDFHVQSDLIDGKTPSEFFKDMADGYDLVGGTAWAFCRPEADGLLDYLFVDEAGQVSIANLVGMSQSARNLILIGDQMQLSQPIQGSHPGESGKSVLEYLLEDKQVVPDDFGIFLGTTWRMHPDLCKFISGAVYEDKLHAEACTAERQLKIPEADSSSVLKKSGIIFVPVMHEGNSQDSPEEASVIANIVKFLLACDFVDASTSRRLTLDDILLVAPYNMQVRRLKEAIPGSRVGSVDKFQGQEAPVVIVSMCSSTGDSSARGLEFIFSKNRLNVAISRAQVLAIVVGSPVLASTHCNRVDQVELVNLFCRIYLNSTGESGIMPSDKPSVERRPEGRKTEGGLLDMIQKSKDTPVTTLLNDLDIKLLEHFRGFVVRKDLVRSVKVGANVPVFVLEYLIANSCSTDDEEKIRTGMENVKKILSDHYVNPEESSLIQSKIREKGRYKIIDKISVELESKKDIYWAKLQNSNIKNGNISDVLVKQHEKMLLGGIWAIIDVEYDPNIRIGQNIFPFVVTEIKPIQLSSFDNTKIVEKRKEFTKGEWLDALLRSCGYEPTAEGVSHRMKMLLLARLLPMVEANFNFVELGPRSTGKSFVFKELTPYAVLISGGQGTVPKLFVHGSTGKVGAVGQWDAICFDESTDRIFKDADAIPMMKDYMESGSFSRAGAGGEITGVASIILNGNINQPVETVLQTSHLFSPLSAEVNDDTAFLDRIHFYLPGWEMIKFAPKHFTSSFGFSTDYFSEVLKSLRRVTYTDAIERFYSLGAHLKQRDTKPVKKTVSGLIKLLHPDGVYTKEDVKEYLEIALEMRRRVKEQLKRIGGMEFWDTNFSYIDKESQEEIFVGLPEERGSHLIESTPLPPGICYTSTSDGDNVALVRIETVAVPGSGKLTITGVNNNAVKENIKNTYQYIRANEKTILSDKHSLKNYDLTIQVTTLLGSVLSSGIGSAVYIAIISVLYKKNLKAGLAVLGNISVGGAIERVINFADKVTMLSENGAKSVIVPMDNLPELSNVPPTVLGNTDVPFYQNNQMLMQKCILLD